MPIFDFRVRPPYKGFLDTVLFKPGTPTVDLFTKRIGLPYPDSARARSVPDMLAEMDAAGIAKGLVVGRESGVYGSVSNADVIAFCREQGGRFLAAASIDPTRRKPCIAAIDQALKDGFIAINLEPGNYPVPMYTDDRRLYPIYAHCEDRGVPVLIQSGGLAGPDISYTSPVMIEHVCTDFPELKVVAVHGGWPWVHEIIHVAWRRPNLYLSPDVYLCGQTGVEEYVRAANGALARQFLFATTYPLCGFADYLARMRALPFKKEVLERFLWQNAEEVLGLAKS
ncbi:MAG: amidohydrolase [Alphaproteobacteria bacterium]|nr:amidohydrolase [Alphaproteobacteria bacterium]